MSLIDRFAILLPTFAVFLFFGCGRPSPEDLFQEGAQLMQQGNFVSARRRFEQILENNPDFELNTNIKIYVADCFNQEGRMDDARTIYEEILREHPGTNASWMAHVRLGDMARIEEDWETAETQFRAAIEDSTDTQRQMRARGNLAESFLQSGSTERAVETYREILSLQEKPIERLQTAQVLTNLYFREGRNEEAWANVMAVDDASYTLSDLRFYYTTVMQTAAATGKFEEAFDYFDSAVDSTTNEDSSSLALYYKGLLASGTDVYLATGLATFKEVRDRFPDTEMGRYVEADAAMIVLSSSDQVSGAVEKASELFTNALDNYDDIINDMTTEWYYPQKSAYAWKQIARIQELRGLNMQNIADLRAASATHHTIVDKFKDYLPDVARDSFNHVQRLTHMVNVAESSPEEFWEDFRRVRAGLPSLAEEAAARAELEAATESETVEAVEP